MYLQAVCDPPVKKREEDVPLNNINYAEAVKRVQGQKGMEEINRINQSSRAGGGQREQAKMTTELAVGNIWI